MHDLLLCVWLCAGGRPSGPLAMDKARFGHLPLLSAKSMVVCARGGIGGKAGGGVSQNFGCVAGKSALRQRVVPKLFWRTHHHVLFACGHCV